MYRKGRERESFVSLNVILKWHVQYVINIRPLLPFYIVMMATIHYCSSSVGCVLFQS